MTSQHIADEIIEQRDEFLRDAQDVKWYVAEEELSERQADEVYEIICQWKGF